MRATIAWLVLLASIQAPMQCATRSRPETEREDTPGEALWRLAEQFGIQGNTQARIDTLHFLVDRYPASRFAQRARAELPPAVDAGGATD